MKKINFEKSSIQLLLMVTLVLVSLIACDTVKKVTKPAISEAISFPSISTQAGEDVFDKKGEKLSVRYVRKNAHEDAENMQILADAMKKMKEMNCTDPMSWYMQGAIHGAPYHGNIFCDSLDYEKAKNDAWHNCTHDYDVLKLNWNEARLHFYTWHKFYLNHFEAAIRHVSGRPDFSMPYWEYDNPDYQTLPALLMDKNSSLYEGYRNDNMNQGNRIEKGLYNDTIRCIPDFTNPVDAFETNSFELFTKHLEGVPHNKMHLYLGKSVTATGPDPIGQDSVHGYMYNMYSPMDPVFWLHHANIDRLYEKWLIERIDDVLSNDGRPTKQEFMNKPWVYKFFNPGDTELTHYDDDMAKVFDEAYGVQDYAYDMFINNGDYNRAYEGQVFTAISTNKWDEDEFDKIDLLVATNDKNINIGGADDFQFTIKSPPSSAFLTMERAMREVWLLSVDVNFTKSPKGSFYVKIQDPQSQGIACTNAVAGVLSFFGAGHNHSESDASSESHNHAGAKNVQETHFLFDITDEIDFTKFSGEMEIEIQPDFATDSITLNKVQLIKRITMERIK